MSVNAALKEISASCRYPCFLFLSMLSLHEDITKEMKCVPERILRMYTNVSEKSHFYLDPNGSFKKIFLCHLTDNLQKVDSKEREKLY